MPDTDPTAPDRLRWTKTNHLAGFVVAMTGPGYMLWTVKAASPPLLWWCVAAMLPLMLLVWIVMLRRTFFANPVPASGANENFDIVTLWLTSLMVVIIIATVQRYADPVTNMLGALFVTGCMVPLAIGTVSQAQDSALARTLPFIMPLAMSAFLIIRGGSHAAVAVAFMLVICVVGADLRSRTLRLIQKADRARADAEAERDARLRFIASAGHDLGQPLQSARLFLDAALRAKSSDAREKSARNAQWAFENAENMLQHVMDHLRLDAGVVTAAADPINLGRVMAIVVALNEPQARLNGVAIRTLPSSITVLGDASHLERALGNLVTNGVRHAKARDILVGAKRCGSRVRVYVIDNGNGVSAADQGRLFDDYFQGSDHQDETRGGFGLGLASTRRLMALMGGRADRDDRWLGGSAFYIELQIANDLPIP